jgi:hypothetical protein
MQEVAGRMANNVINDDFMVGGLKCIIYEFEQESRDSCFHCFCNYFQCVNTPCVKSTILSSVWFATCGSYRPFCPCHTYDPYPSIVTVKHVVPLPHIVVIWALLKK